MAYQVTRLAAKPDNLSSVPRIYVVEVQHGTQMKVCMCVYIVCTCACMCVCMCVYVCVHTHAHTHKQINLFIYLLQSSFR